MQQQRKSRAQRAGNKEQDTGREISYNPAAGRPQIHLKTPRQSAIKGVNAINVNTAKKLQQKQLGESQERSANKDQSSAGNNLLPNV